VAAGENSSVSGKTAGRVTRKGVSKAAVQNWRTAANLLGEKGKSFPPTSST